MAQLIQEGTLLAGKYRVEQVLGRGGMGVVLAATHLHLEQRVAIKVLSPEKSLSGDAVGRFLREARASVRLKSEYVARTLDVGTLNDGEPYMVMEYLQGHDLQKELELRGTLPLEMAAEFLLQACEGLAEAHALRIVHRDLKPANLFLTTRTDGSPCIKILDFGISKLHSDNNDQGLTQTSTILGTPYYMSPEQLRSSRDVDARSDVWSLGIIFQELLTGHHAFTAEALPELCARILTEAPEPLDKHRSDLPPDLGWILDKCLEKSPEDRYQSVAELARAVAQFHPQGDAFTARISRILQREISSPSLALPRVSPIATTLAQPSPDKPQMVTLQAVATPPRPTPSISPASVSAPPTPWKPALLGVALLATVILMGRTFSRPAPAAPDTPSVSAPATSGSESVSAPPASSSAPLIVLVAPPPPLSASAPAAASAVPPRAAVRRPQPPGPSRPAPIDFGTRK